MSDEIKIDISQFTDYRDYLSALFQAEKKQRKAFSYEFCARRLGLSRSFLLLVHQKKRHLNLDSLPSFWRLYKLTGTDRQALLFLFLYTLTSDPEGKESYLGTFHALCARRTLEAAEHGGSEGLLLDALWTRVEAPEATL